MLKEFWTHLYESTILFAVSLFIVRFMGKRTLAQLSPFDLLYVIIMGAAIAIPLEDEKIKLSCGIIPVLVLTVLNYILSVVITKNRKIENLLQGPSTVLVRDGDVVVENLKKERITMADLLLLLRENDVWNINEVEEATIEPNGKLSVIKKKYMQAVTPKDLGLWTNQGIFPTLVIDSGEVIEDNLSKLEVGIDQVIKELSKKNLERLDKISSLWIDEEGNMIVGEENLMRDKIKNEFYKLNINKEDIEKEFGIDINLFLDAISLGLSDEQISDIIGCDLDNVKKIREKLGDVTSDIGINYKKDIPPE